MALANSVALKPTGPWPNTARVSAPVNFMRLMAANAVPVPQATAAPSENDNASGSGTRVLAGTFM